MGVLLGDLSRDEAYKIFAPKRALISRIGRSPKFFVRFYWMDTLRCLYAVAAEEVTIDFNSDPMGGIASDIDDVLRGGARLEQEIVSRGAGRRPIIIDKDSFNMEDLAKARNLKY